MVGKKNSTGQWARSETVSPRTVLFVTTGATEVSRVEKKTKCRSLTSFGMTTEIECPTKVLRGEPLAAFNQNKFSRLVMVENHNPRTRAKKHDVFLFPR